MLQNTCINKTILYVHTLILELTLTEIKGLFGLGQILYEWTLYKVEKHQRICLIFDFNIFAKLYVFLLQLGNRWPFQHILLLYNKSP